MTLLPFAALLVAGTVAAPPANPNPWKEVNRDDGVIVWTRDVPGSDIREAKAETVVNAPLDRVIAAITDIEHYPEFMPYVLEARVVGTIDAATRYEYQLIDPPLVDKRDYTLKVSFELDEAKGLYRRSWVQANDKGPRPLEDVVRVPVCDGSWTATRLTPQTTRVVYWLYTSPGGSIPSWIANRANTSSLPELMLAVKKRALDPGWKND